MNGANDHESISDLIPAYALGALDSEEAGMVAKHLATCSLCQEELAAYETVVASIPIALTEVVPSPAVRARLLERIAIEPAPAAGTVAPEPPQSSGLSQALRHFLAGPRWQPVVAGLVIAGCLLLLGIWIQSDRQDRSSFDQVVMTGTEAAPEASGLIVISEDGEHGTLVVDRLPQLDEEIQQYQLWLIKDGQRVSGGVFSVYEEGYHSLQVESPEPLGSYTSFGITIEPAGGSPGPTGARVLEYNL